MEVFITSHSTYLQGPAQYLERYLRRKKLKVIHLTHPLDNYRNRKSLLFINGKTVKEYKRIPHGFFNLFEDLYITLINLYKKQYGEFIGTNNFDTLSGIIANIFFNKKAKVIYFATDFSEDRFKNMFLDWIYIKVEKIVIKNSRFVISNTSRAEKKRIELGLDPKKSLIIPNGICMEKPIFTNKKINNNKFIYVGNVTQEHGILEYINIMHKSIGEIVIIGSGNGWGELIKSLNIHKIKSRLFYRKSNKFVLNYLQKFDGFGIAPYNKVEKWTYYASPLKIIEYIATGVPVITSNITEISKLIAKDNLGIVYENLNVENLTRKIKNFNTENYYKKSELFYKKYNYDYLFSKLKL